MTTEENEAAMAVDDVLRDGVATLVAEDAPAVVIDNGTGRIKAGFAGDEGPVCVFQSVVGARREDMGARMITVGGGRDTYVGEEALARRGVPRIRRPIEHGVVDDWGDMESIWEHTFCDHLKVDPSERPVLMTEAPLNPRANREKMATVLFEALGVPAMYVSLQAVLSLYSTGRVTGLVLDSGDGVTHAVPVFEGYSMGHAIQRVDLAGRDVTEYMSRILRENGHTFATPNGMEIVRDMKERLCYVAPSAEEAHARSDTKKTYELPDGATIEVSDDVCRRAPEILFDSAPVGAEHPGLPGMVSSAIAGCDIDTRRALYDNVVMSGGSTMFPGVVERVQTELRGIGSDASRRARVVAPPEREFSVWIGGSILAGLESFSSAWITRQEYEEYGPGIVARKCF